MNATIQIGLERCLEKPVDVLRSGRFGLLMNQASVDGSLDYSCDVLARRFPGQLAALFSPQHGLWCEQQANMIESDHGWYEPLGVPVHSLYSETRQPTTDMLRGLECLVVDLQDVGTRVYTFAWTMLNCLRSCAAAGIPVVVLDRPNPLGGLVAEGPLLEAEFRSFVGGVTIPLRHGLTLGELARLMNAEQNLGAELTVIPMSGWRRSMLWHDTGRTWVAPSPNMPRESTAIFYPGQVLLEGTNLSEGRGTTQPFEMIGAPFIQPHVLASELNAAPLPGVAIRPVRFVPTFDKWQGQRCGGVALHITNPAGVRSVELTIRLVAAIGRLWPDGFQWLPPPYEYERDKMPIDILFGSPRLREASPARTHQPDAPARNSNDMANRSLACAAGLSEATIVELASLDEAAWWRRVQPYLLYD